MIKRVEWRCKADFEERKSLLHITLDADTAEVACAEQRHGARVAEICGILLRL